MSEASHQMTSNPSPKHGPRRLILTPLVPLRLHCPPPHSSAPTHRPPLTRPPSPQISHCSSRKPGSVDRVQCSVLDSKNWPVPTGKVCKGVGQMCK